jgi:hypothetical protein
MAGKRIGAGVRRFKILVSVFAGSDPSQRAREMALANEKSKKNLARRGADVCALVQDGVLFEATGFK